jgi:hypothetical protein
MLRYVGKPKRLMTDSSMLLAEPARECPRYPFAEWEREWLAREGLRTSELVKEIGELRVEVTPKSYEQEETGEVRVLWVKGLDPRRIIELGRE